MFFDNNRPCLKRCLENYASREDLENEHFIEKPGRNREIRDVVLGAQLLNACKCENVAEAFNILSNITSMTSLVVKDANGLNAFRIAASSTKMSDVVCRIKEVIGKIQETNNDKAMFNLMNYCKNDNHLGIALMFGIMGRDKILSYNKYTSASKELVMGTLSRLNLMR